MDDLLELARSVVRSEAAGIADLESQLDERLLAAARMLIEAPGKVLTSGVGTSGQTARRLAHLLSVTGTPALYVNPVDGLHGGLGALGRGDVLVVVSKNGDGDEVHEFVERARGLAAPVIVLSSVADSRLAVLGDLTVILSVPRAADPGGIVAMGSSLVFSAWGDALAMVAMRLRGYRWEQVLFAHPGGAVGRLAIGDLEAAPGGGEVVAAAPQASEER